MLLYEKNRWRNSALWWGVFLSKPPTSFTRCVLHLYLHTLSYTHTHTLSHSLNPFFPTPAALERLEEVMVHQLSVSCMDQTPLDCCPGLPQYQAHSASVQSPWPGPSASTGSWVLALGLGSAGQGHPWLGQFLPSVTCEGSALTDRCPSPAPGGAALLSTGHCSAAWDCPGFGVTATCSFLQDDSQQKPLSFDSGKKEEVLAALSWLWVRSFD